MSFKARLVNTIIFVGMNLVKNFWIIPKWEEMLDEFYPEDSRPKRPSLLKLEKEAGLALQFGNNFIMDGMRPISPNYVMIGMINCRKGNHRGFGCPLVYISPFTVLTFNFPDSSCLTDI